MLSASGLLSMPHWASDPRCERPHHRPGRYPAQTDGTIPHTIAGEDIPCERRLGDSATRRLGDSATRRLGDRAGRQRASHRARRSRRGVPPSRPSPTAKGSPQPPSRRAGRRRRLGRRCLGAARSLDGAATSTTGTDGLGQAAYSKAGLLPPQIAAWLPQQRTCASTSALAPALLVPIRPDACGLQVEHTAAPGSRFGCVGAPPGTDSTGTVASPPGRGRAWETLISFLV